MGLFMIFPQNSSDNEWRKTLVEVHSLGQLNTANMTNFFSNCKKLRYFNLGEYDNSANVEAFANMFRRNIY